MNNQRFLHRFVMSASVLLGIGMILALVYYVPVVASVNLPQPTPVLSEPYCKSDAFAPANSSTDCLNPPDQSYSVSNTVKNMELEEPAIPQTGSATGTVDYRFSTLTVPEDMTQENLSPPDQPTTATDLDEATAPLQGYNASVHIAGSVIRPRSSDVEWQAGGQGGCIYAFSGSTATWWNTPVYLPQGATVKYFRMYINDTDVNYNSFGYFTIYDLYGDVVNEWGVDSSGSTGKAYWTTAEFTHTVDYDNYSYVVNWQPGTTGTSVQACGFRIYYHTPPTPIYLPLVMKNVP